MPINSKNGVRASPSPSPEREALTSAGPLKNALRYFVAAVSVIINGCSVPPSHTADRTEDPHASLPTAVSVFDGDSGVVAPSSPDDSPGIQFRTLPEQNTGSDAGANHGTVTVEDIKKMLAKIPGMEKATVIPFPLTRLSVEGGPEDDPRLIGGPAMFLCTPPDGITDVQGYYLSGGTAYLVKKGDDGRPQCPAAFRVHVGDLTSPTGREERDPTFHPYILIPDKTIVMPGRVGDSVDNYSDYADGHTLCVFDGPQARGADGKTIYGISVKGIVSQNMGM